jgi:SAM-dependent methyltransferase
MDRLADLANTSGARDVIEIGPGTGNATGAFLAAHPCRLTAVDQSAGMIAKARAKGLGASFVQGDVQALPLPSDSADMVFGCYVLQHLTDLKMFLGECRRVLRGGVAAFVTASHAFIRSHPMQTYFPSFVPIDTARFPDIPVVHAAMRESGFAKVHAEVVGAQPVPIDAAYAEKIASKFISTYDLIPPDEYAEGLARLEADVAAQGQLAEPFMWEATVVWGHAE